MVNSANYHALSSQQQSLETQTTKRTEPVNARPNTHYIESDVEYRPKVKLWRDPGFPGWREYIKNALDNSREFLSLNDILEFFSENDIDEKKRLESSISNALTTLYQRGEVGAIQVLGERGRFYGTPFIFENGRPEREAETRLRRRLKKRIDEFAIQEVLLLRQ